MAVLTLEKPTIEELIEKLYQTKGKAEIINGEIVNLPLDGCFPAIAKSNIAFSLRQFEKNTNFGFATPSNVGYIVDLPHRKSFCSSVAFHVGNTTGMKFLEGAPIFAVEVRNENDYGKTAEKSIAEKRNDYFAAGTEIVWDIDLLSEDVIKSYSRNNPNEPRIFRRGEIADAEPTLPDWKMAVDELFE